MKDIERNLREALARINLPAEDEATERAWRLIRVAYAERPEAETSSRLRRRALQLALGVGLLAALVSPAGAAVRRWVADAVNPGREPSQPALTSLPTRGSLLIQSPTGSWVVHADGSKRLLGVYTAATWSPHGLFVATTTRHELATVDPSGEARWTVDRRGPVRLPSWNRPDGFRIAYHDGTSLRVVDGDGRDDHQLASHVAPVAPAWMPGSRYVLAFTRSDGAVVAEQADSGKVAFETRPGPRVLSLQWSSDGRSLLVTRSTDVALYDRDGNLRWHRAAPAGTRIVAAQLTPKSERLALILSRGSGSRLLLVGPGMTPRIIFSGPGRFSGLSWSPDGRWLLLAWKSADQWLFLNSSQPRRIVAVSNITKQFAPGARQPGRVGFPQVSGWCCTR